MPISNQTPDEASRKAIAFKKSSYKFNNSLEENHFSLLCLINERILMNITVIHFYNGNLQCFYMQFFISYFFSKVILQKSFYFEKKSKIELLMIFLINKFFIYTEFQIVTEIQNLTFWYNNKTE